MIIVSETRMVESSHCKRGGLSWFANYLACFLGLGLFLALPPTKAKIYI